MKAHAAIVVIEIWMRCSFVTIHRYGFWWRSEGSGTVWEIPEDKVSAGLFGIRVLCSSNLCIHPHHCHSGSQVSVTRLHTCITLSLHLRKQCIDKGWPVHHTIPYHTYINTWWLIALCSLCSLGQSVNQWVMEIWWPVWNLPVRASVRVLSLFVLKGNSSQL